MSNINYKILNSACIYFCQPYRDDPKDYIEKYGIRVYRPNHGLGHSGIQYFLAGDIVDFLDIPWANKNKVKIQMAAAFQRSGRQQEGSSDYLGDKYDQYEEEDLINFDREAKRLNIFTDNKRRLFRESIRWSTTDNSNLQYSPLVRDIIQAAHILNLRRMPKFDMNRIRREAAEKLAPYFNRKELKEVIDELWELTGEYLRVLGDRDGYIGKNYYSERFYYLSNDPYLLVKELSKV